MIALLLRRWADHRASLAAALFLLGVVTLAAVAPAISPYGPLQLGQAPLAAPSWSHLMGTDQLGRDVFTRVCYGARVSLLIAAGGVGVSLLAGTAIGLVAGYVGGAVDAGLSRVVDVMFCVPDILLALVVLAILGPGFDRIALAIAIVYTPPFARVARGAVLTVAQQPYVEAARALGVGRWRIMTRHILPNAAGLIIVQATLSLAFAVLMEAALSFLGLSGQADAATWGGMLRQGKDFMQLAWWSAFFPGLAICLTVLCFNLLGDGLRDAVAGEA